MIDVVATPPSPQPRRIATPRWFDLRLVIGVLLVLGSVLVGAAVVSRSDHTRATVSATRDLAAGTVVTSADVRLAQVQLPPGGSGVYLTSVDDAVGRTLVRAVTRGELVPAQSVAVTRASTTVTVPFASGTAPTLRAGQRVEIWVSTPSCTLVVLLPDVTVQSVHADGGGSFGSASSGQDVVISVPPDTAGRVLTALSLPDAKLRAGILAGGSAASDGAQAAPLPALGGCVSTSPSP